MKPGDLGVLEIRRALQRQVHVKQISTLYWPVPLFEIFAAIARRQFFAGRGMA